MDHHFFGSHHIFSSLADSAAMMVGLFLDSTLASHTVSSVSGMEVKTFKEKKSFNSTDIQ